MAKVKHFLKLNDFNFDELSYLFERAAVIKENYKSYKKTWTLEDRTLVMIFEKASTRTRLSFEASKESLVLVLAFSKIITKVLSSSVQVFL